MSTVYIDFFHIIPISSIVLNDHLEKKLIDEIKKKKKTTVFVCLFVHLPDSSSQLPNHIINEIKEF